ncbi:dihydrolipoamide acetyltransferase family protein [Streptomyces sp. NEAU-S7GS2]|uniref:dihydrolipoamide acetyltransferase family protein n=1 Tax=Streptomyces sp. NEAU-S7GS2 TaxID=2202000 RepID=UPI000D6EFEFE|nr:dihydrolipoamide acetyltransferase family protein [Streptomyces sp. NEAU-S7GS2]AWN30534.1 dehydrogenase [Streptomyces sp. NEAU-S7GS2]
MAEFVMPSLGADMDEGILQEWLVAPGDQIARGDPVAVVETAKSAIEVECFETGTVGRLLVEPGTTVPVGAPLAVIEPMAAKPRPRKRARADAAAEHKKAAATPPRAGRTRAAAAEGEPRTIPVAAPAPASADGGHAEAGPLIRHLAEQRGVNLRTLQGSGPGGRITRADIDQAVGSAARPPRVRATPLARRLAGELAIDLSTLTGTGQRGAVRAADVRKAAEAPVHPPSRPHSAAPAPSPSAISATGARQAIAGLMARANREIPHYYLATTVDMAAAMDWLHEHNRHRPPAERLLPAALLLKAAALAAREVPDLNGFWADDRFTTGDGVHLGVAVSLRGGGLVAPTVRDADRLGLGELMATLKDLVGRTRGGRLRGSEVSAATLTVTSLGDQGVETVFGVIHPPQVALVGFGRVVNRPCAVDGLIGVRPQVTATLSADHRATDGVTGARYLTAVDRLLQHPEEL